MNNHMYRSMSYHSSAPIMSTARMQEGDYSYSINDSSMSYHQNYHTNHQSSMYTEPIDYPPRALSHKSHYQQETFYSRPYSPVSMSTPNPKPVTKSAPFNTQANMSSVSNAKKLSTVRCDDCNIDFTSQVVLDAHLQGARHAKQVKSKDILANLKQTKVPFSNDEDANGLKCNVCNVYLNSIQQLQTHLEGNRHQKKLSKGDWTGTEVISKAKIEEIPEKSLPRPAEKNVLLSCKTCNKFFNSSSQLNMHLTSQKHLDRVVGRKSEKVKRFSPYYKERVQNYAQQPLNNSFISGGYQQYG